MINPPSDYPNENGLHTGNSFDDETILGYRRRVCFLLFFLGLYPPRKEWRVPKQRWGDEDRGDKPGQWRRV